MGLPVRIQPQVLVELCEYRKATVSGLISTDKFRFAAAAKGEGGPIQLRVAAFLGVVEPRAIDHEHYPRYQRLQVLRQLVNQAESADSGRDARNPRETFVMQDTDKQRTEELNQLRLALATFALQLDAFEARLRRRLRKTNVGPSTLASPPDIRFTKLGAKNNPVLPNPTFDQTP
jgi:hypothetical protein